MTVEQTIEHLKTYPPDHEVMFFDYACDLCAIAPEDIEHRTVVIDQSPCVPRTYYSQPRLALTEGDMRDHRTIQALVIGLNNNGNEGVDNGKN